MPPILEKTFGGLSPRYYFRQLFFGFLIFAFFAFVMSRGAQSAPIWAWCFGIVSTFLYPYSRFVYEGTARFIVGENVFLVNAILMLGIKLFTMMMCWEFAVCVAPIGLLYLFYYHSKG